MYPPSPAGLKTHKVKGWNRIGQAPPISPWGTSLCWAQVFVEGQGDQDSATLSRNSGPSLYSNQRSSHSVSQQVHPWDFWSSPKRFLQACSGQYICSNEKLGAAQMSFKQLKNQGHIHTTEQGSDWKNKVCLCPDAEGIQRYWYVRRTRTQQWCAGILAE